MDHGGKVSARQNPQKSQKRDKYCWWMLKALKEASQKSRFPCVPSMEALV